MSDPVPSGAGLWGDRTPARSALVLLLSLGAAYLALQRDSYFGDARHLIDGLGRGLWIYSHRAYLPAGHLAELFAPSSELALRLLSAASAACGCGLVFLAARALGRGWVPAVSAALLLAASPAVLFFATTVEVHALTLVPAGIAVLWAAHALRRCPPWGDALAPLLLLLALFSAHLASALWAPAAVLVAFWDGERLVWPRRWRLAAAALALYLAAFVLLQHTGRSHGWLMLASVSRWSPSGLASELLLPAGLLVPLALVGAQLAWRARDRGIRVLGPPALLLFLSYLVFLPGVPVDEQGGYFLPLHPVLALLATCALAALRGRPWIAAALVAGQAAWGAHTLWSYERRYPGHEWIEPLVEELAGGGVVITLHVAEWQALNAHAPLHLAAFGPVVGEVHFDLAAPETLALVVQYADQARAAGGDLAITRTLLQAEGHGAPVLVAALRERYGEPRAGRRPEYLVFPLR